MNKAIFLTAASVLIISTVGYAGVTTTHLEYEKENFEPTMVKLTEQMDSWKQVDLSSQVLSQKPGQQKIETVLPQQSPAIVKEKETNETTRKYMSSLPKVAGFTLDEVIDYGHLADLGYIDPLAQFDPAKSKEIKASTLKKFDTIEKLQADGNRVQFFGKGTENAGLIITHTDGRVSVVYKGTNSLENLAADLKFNMAIDDVTGLRGHNGFMNEFYQTKDQVFAILEQIAQLRGKTLKQLLEEDVTATGHSLGAALAEMFMGYTHKKLDAVTKAVTFATPRIFDVASAEELQTYYKDRFTNVMHIGDPATAALAGVMGYKHFGTKLHIPYSKTDKVHGMRAYLNALEAMRVKANSSQAAGTIFAFEESKRTGIGNAKWIGYTSIPNPIYPLHVARETIARHVDPVIHKALKAVKDGMVNLVSSPVKPLAPAQEVPRPSFATKVADTAKIVANGISTGASRFVSGVQNVATKAKSAATSAWNSLKSFWG